MTMTNVSGLSTLGNPPVSTRKLDQNKPEGGKKTIDDVLASLREMMPGWTISTSTADWGEGFRNIQIDRDILQQMADDPKAMEKYSALIRDFENSVSEVEKWGKENPGQSFEIGFSIDSKGNVTALAVVRTLMGVEKRINFNLPQDRKQWTDIIRDRLEALNESKVENITGSKSWIA